MTVVQFRSRRPIHPTPDLTLPAGRMHNDLWVSDEPIADATLYLACVAAYPRTGRWPVLIPRDPRFELTGEDWIDDRGWLPPAADGIDDVDVEQALTGWWAEPCCEGACLHPFDDGVFPGLARKSPRRADPIAEAGNTGSILAARGDYRLGIVESPRPSDVPAVLGWQGMATMTDQVAAISAVLRSWEDRFGAVLISLGFDTIDLSVAAPPKSKDRALTVAAEHRAFCIGNFTEQPGSLREFAAGLTGRRLWSFWWD
ncbi:DUF4253 domain-containing protein [Prauserella cavernicola]|uniref:DUF4253 domain-containing protein n=1 Tax=Prauserella cavernicola TaxID=2800127 RepID=A0A934V4F1_9PSEU|nr:DUF4253 domain-containing protein [Prauserella cavernicola]MBK1785352.1 DUF4253 domain-containing protein [Prauserella cavernicola]